MNRLISFSKMESNICWLNNLSKNRDIIARRHSAEAVLGKEQALLLVWEELHLQKAPRGPAWLLKGKHLLTVVVVLGLEAQAQEHQQRWGAPFMAQQVQELELQLEEPESEEALRQLA